MDGGSESPLIHPEPEQVARYRLPGKGVPEVPLTERVRRLIRVDERLTNTGYANVYLSSAVLIWRRARPEPLQGWSAGYSLEPRTLHKG